MANENDVVRLKHLQPLVSGVANDFSIQNGDDAVRLKHLVSLASALDKQAPVLSLGSWSAVDSVYSAAITYTGDGTLSTDVGTIANDILTVEDADGNFSGVISAAEGTNFAPAQLVFNHSKETVGGGSSSKIIPELIVYTDSIHDYTDYAVLGDTLRISHIPYAYDGDGELFLRFYVQDSYIITAGFEADMAAYFFVLILSVDGGFEALETIYGTLYARESANYAEAECSFEFTLP